MFYSELLSSPISSSSVKRIYGVNPDNDPTRAALIGIYPLTEAPEGYTASHYVKAGSTYTAIASEITDVEREYIARIKIVAANLREFVRDCIPDWDAAVSYLAGSYVEHNGSLWQAASASTGVEPAFPEDPETPNPDWTFIR